MKASLVRRLFVLLSLTLVATCGAWMFRSGPRSTSAPRPRLVYQPRQDIEKVGYSLAIDSIPSWGPEATFAEIAEASNGVGYRVIADIDRDLSSGEVSDQMRVNMLLAKATLLNYEGDPHRAYQVLEELRALVESKSSLAKLTLYTIVFYQGMTALRRGENENCIMCRGESSCILPISAAAVHTNPEGSRLAIRHFTEYLEEFPNDLEVQWLMNLAHMTLGEHPQQVDPRFLVRLDRFANSEFDIGKFRDVGHLVGINRLNQAGGAIMEDFDNDGLLDLFATTFDASSPVAYFGNTGAGTFSNLTVSAGLSNQLGGFNCVQTDYNNDGRMDVFIVRGAWLANPIRPTLLQNDGNGQFTDVTEAAGLAAPANSISATWADYDNDGWLDLFVCCERQPSRLYHNLRDGTFEEVAGAAGVLGQVQTDCKGAAWIDYDNDDWPDLFVNYLTAPEGAELLRNNHDGTFTAATRSMNVRGPFVGFSCWAWDYDNDGWLDIFATSYDSKLSDIVKGVVGEPHDRNFSRLYRNDHGQGFEDKTREAGLDMVFATMGSNFGDFDNDGFLDMYLGTGAPALSMLCPNRMFKNVAGQRFAEITGSSRTGNLQKGHGVACGDWDGDGDIDIFIEMGGAITGDKYHNILFQNPGQGNHWLKLKLVGKTTNRPAIGARIKVVTTANEPLTIHRHITSGSSFGANPLPQTIGLGAAERITRLEIHWPTSGTTQTFEDLAIDQSIEVTEFANSYRQLDWSPIPLPK